MTTDELKQKIRQTLTLNPDKKITPAELEDVMIDMVDNQPRQGSVIKKELFFDDGSGEVVPVKHPDLSTQPSILPYKFAGNYVYEQMFYINEEISELSHLLHLTGDLIGINDGIVILESSFSGETNEGLIKTREHEIIVQGGAEGTLIEVAPNGPDSFTEVYKNGWVRLVWTTKPKAGGYYYSAQETKLTFVNNTDGRVTYLYNDEGRIFYSKSDKIEIDSEGKELLLQGGYLKWDGLGEENVVFIYYKGSRRNWYRRQPLYLRLSADHPDFGKGIVLDSIIGITIQEFITGNYAVEIVS